MVILSLIAMNKNNYTKLLDMALSRYFHAEIYFNVGLKCCIFVAKKVIYVDCLLNKILAVK